MAMVSTHQKPKRRNRNGEVPEGLPGSTKSMACVERDGQELGRPEWLPRRAGRLFREKEGQSKAIRESDQPIVLRDGRADYKGKGLTVIRSLQRKH